MAATYRSSSATNTGATPASSLTISVPAGYQANDYFLASVSIDGNTSTVTTPTGWTQLRDITSAGAGLHLAVFWHLATASEPANYTWTFDTAHAASGSIMAYSGANIFAPVTPAVLSNSSNTTLSTSLVASNVNSAYDTGQAVQIFATRNSTAVGTLTAGGSYTKRDDTSSTAATFIGLCTQDVSRGLPVGGTSASNATTTQASTALCCSIFIEDARPDFSYLLIDEYSVQSGTTAKTTIDTPIQTNQANMLVLTFVSINKDVATVSSLTGVATWTLLARSNVNAGSVEVWRAFVASPVTSQNVTITFSASVVSYNVAFVGFYGADPTSGDGSSGTGLISTHSTTAAAPSQAVNTTRNNSWVFAIANANATGTMTAGSNQTLFRSQNDTTNGAQSWMWRRTALTPGAGTSVTMNSTSPSTANCNMVIVEVLPAQHYSLSSLGVG